MYKSRLAQDLANQPGITADGREERIDAARKERRNGTVRGVTAIAGSAALIALGVHAAPEGTFTFNDPAAEKVTHQVGDITPGIDPNEPLRIDKNGLPYVEDEPQK